MEKAELEIQAARQREWEEQQPLTLFDVSRGEPESLEQAVQIAVGAASACWEKLEGAGVFQDDRALAIGEQLITWLRGVIPNDRIDQAVMQGYREAIDTNRDTILRLEDELSVAREQLRIEKAAAMVMDTGWVPPPALPPQLVEMIGLVIMEYQRAKAKHGEKTMDGPGYTPEQRLAILVEEAGEVSEEVLNAALQSLVGAVGHTLTYDQPGVEGGHLGRLLKELVQVAAMAVTWGSVVVPGPAVTAREPQVAPTGQRIAVSGTEGPGRVEFYPTDGQRFTAGRVRPLEAVEAGSTVRVPPGTCAVMVPRDRVHEVLRYLERG